MRSLLRRAGRMTNFRGAVVCGVGRVDGLDCGAVSGEMKNLCVVLVGTRNPLNVGAVARAMSNFGAMELRAVRPYEKAWREAKSAVGAGELLARAKEFANLAEAVADCSLVVGTTAVGNREMKHPLRGLDEGARLIGKRMARGQVAAVVMYELGRQERTNAESAEKTQNTLRRGEKTAPLKSKGAAPKKEKR